MMEARTVTPGDDWIQRGVLLEKRGTVLLGEWKFFDAATAFGKAAALQEEKGSNADARRLYALAADAWMRGSHPISAAYYYAKAGDFNTAKEVATNLYGSKKRGDKYDSALAFDRIADAFGERGDVMNAEVYRDAAKKAREELAASSMRKGPNTKN